MGEGEEQLQKEWRSLMVSKLDSLEDDIRGLRYEVQAAVSVAADVASLKNKVEKCQNEITKEQITNNKIKNEIEASIKENYVSKEVYEPIKRIVYGGVGLVLIAVATALIAVVIKG